MVDHQSPAPGACFQPFDAFFLIAHQPIVDRHFAAA
jgi:hypothetical protein